MGYRSQVTFVVRFNNLQDRDAMWTLYANCNDEHKRDVANHLEQRYGNDPLVTFSDSHLKWYPEYPFVKAAHAFMEEAEEMFNASWRFVRIGEEDNDIEVNEGGEDCSDLYDMVYPVSSIEICFPPLADEVSASSSTATATQGE